MSAATQPETAASEPCRFGVVIIGRNEGDRLTVCLESLSGIEASQVYVDSCSVDDSVENARRFGAEIVELDAGIPLSAARARNEGFARLRQLDPDLSFVQFVDGDCEVNLEWLERAVTFLDEHPDVAVVAGRRRERFPEASPYNRLANMEWDTPIGEAEAVGGDAMIRVEALEDAGGYNARLIGGEDPELYLRIRQLGYRVMRLDVEMTIHDAAIYKFSQWWRRNVRAGHGFAETCLLHMGEEEQFYLRKVLSIIAWGGGLPAVAFLGAIPSFGCSHMLLWGYAVLWTRVYNYRIARGDDHKDALLYATAIVVGIFPEFQGVVRFVWSHFVQKKSVSLIEYKGPART